jgi:hypothetical protein
MAKPKKSMCTDEQKTSCESSIPDLPECAAEQTFDEAACCATCKRRGSRGKGNETENEMRERCTPAIKDTCGKSQFMCKPGVEAESDGLCCKTCKRANEGKSLNDMRKCAKPPKCADDEVSSQVENAEGFMCASCHPGKPVCPNACAASEVCVRAKAEDSDANAKCVSKEIKAFKLEAKGALKDMFAANNTGSAEEIETMLTEIAQRYCDDPINDVECAASLQALVDGMVVKVVAKQSSDDDAEAATAEVEVSVAEAASRRRTLLQETTASSPGALLDNAMAASSDSTLVVTAEPATASDNFSAATGTIPGVAAVFTALGLATLFL